MVCIKMICFPAVPFVAQCPGLEIMYFLCFLCFVLCPSLEIISFLMHSLVCLSPGSENSGSPKVFCFFYVQA